MKLKFYEMRAYASSSSCHPKRHFLHNAVWTRLVLNVTEAKTKSHIALRNN